MRIPSDLQEADLLLAKYGRWAMDRFKKQHCASAEHKYRPPPSFDNRDEPMEPLMADFSAMDVQRALQAVPLQYRRVLQAQYIPQRLPMEAQRRMLRLTRSTWDGSHLAGLRMFSNIWKAQLSKNATRPKPIACSVDGIV
jgi:hypothetical protein